MHADATLLPKGQDTRVVGATALMFHDRRATLSKMKRLNPPLQTSQVDYSLWLSRSPPEGLEYQRAAFIWWTSTHYKMRRCVKPQCFWHASQCLPMLRTEGRHSS